MTIVARLKCVSHLLFVAVGATLAGCGASVYEGAPDGELSVLRAYAPSPPPGAAVGAAFLEIVNRTEASDRLLGVKSSACKVVEMHETVAKDGTLSMVHRPDGFEIAPGRIFQLKPGGAHLMLLGLKSVEVGGSIPLEMRFETAGVLRVNVPVGDGYPPSACCSN